VVDTIVLDIFAVPTQKGPGAARGVAKDQAGQAVDLEMQTLSELSKHLTIRPLVTALASWYPGNPAPASFSRHASAHCTGDPAVFSDEFSLIAVMLAASLAIQYGL